MAVQVIAISMSAGGHKVEHISKLRWTDNARPKSTIKDTTRSGMVDFIEKGGVAFTRDKAGNQTNLEVVTPSIGAKYVRTIADGTTSDNLLKLPRF